MRQERIEGGKTVNVKKGSTRPPDPKPLPINKCCDCGRPYCDKRK